jgi:hypothetical protein
MRELMGVHSKGNKLGNWNNFDFLALNFVIGWLNLDETLVSRKMRPQSRALLALKTE